MNFFVIVFLFTFFSISITASPIISVSDTLINFSYTQIGKNSSSKVFSVGGNNLEENLQITAPCGYLLSLTNETDFSSSLTLEQYNGVIELTSVYVKFCPRSAGCNIGVVSFTSSNISKFMSVETPLYYSLIFKLISGTNSDETIVRFFDPATEGFDSNYDAPKSDNGVDSPSISTTINGIIYAINSLPISFMKEVRMPLNVTVKLHDTFKLEGLGISSFDPSISVYLEDLESGQMFDFGKDSSYEFTMNTISGDRFVLHFETKTVTALTKNNIQELDEEFLSIRAGKIKIDEGKLLPFSVINLEIYNTLGQKVFGKMNICNYNGNIYTLNTEALPADIYLIQALYNGKWFFAKTYLH